MSAMNERGDSVQRPLEIARIPAQRWGRARLARLGDAERDLYRWILRSFAAGGRPNAVAVRENATRLGLEPGDALATLAREDLVHCDASTGEIVVAYPFSGRPTPHRVCIGGRSEVDAMCAIDALGIPFMLGEPTETVSRDPLTGEEVRTWVDPDGAVRWEPEAAAVLAGSDRDEGPASAVCCAFVNFFASRENAERYLRENPAVRGDVISIPEAVEAGRTVFARLLGDVSPAGPGPRARA
jgi:Alkylmercury lyase